MDKVKERNLLIMEHNVAIVMKSYIHFDENGIETEIPTPADCDGFLFIKAAAIPSNAALDLETAMLKLGWMWVGVREGKAH